MTLEELLALLPDNDTGEIDAVDLRTIVSEMWAHDDALEARLSALEVADPESGFSVTGVWRASLTTPGALPSTGQVTCDSTSMGTATNLYLWRWDKNGQDSAASLLNARAIFAQEKDNSVNYVTYTVRAVPTLTGSVVTVPVTVDKANGTAGAAHNQDASLVINVGTSTAQVLPA